VERSKFDDDFTFTLRSGFAVPKMPAIASKTIAVDLGVSEALSVWNDCMAGSQRSAFGES